MIERAVQCPMARTMGMTALLHILHLLFGVWTVAYNFVPGGEYTREHTDWQVWFLILTLGLATTTGRCTSPSNSAVVRSTPYSALLQSDAVQHALKCYSQNYVMAYDFIQYI